MTKEEKEQLNRELALGLMEYPLQEIPKGKQTVGECIAEDSLLWRDVVQQAINAKLVLRLTACWKGLDYSADFKGWHFNWHIPYRETYRASDVVVLEGDVDDWKCPMDEGLTITVAQIPDYTGSTDLAWEVWDKYKKKYGGSLLLEITATVRCRVFNLEGCISDITSVNKAEAICHAVLAATKQNEK